MNAFESYTADRFVVKDTKTLRRFDPKLELIRLFIDLKYVRLKEGAIRESATYDDVELCENLVKKRSSSPDARFVWYLESDEHWKEPEEKK